MSFENGHAGSCAIYFGGTCNCPVGRLKEAEETIVRAAAFVEELKKKHQKELEDFRSRAVRTCLNLGIKYHHARPGYQRCASSIAELPLVTPTN